MAASRSPRQRAKVTDEVMSPTTILVERISNPGSVKTPKGKQKTRVVEIHWVDAQAIGGNDWVGTEGVNLHGAPSLAVGYVVAETEKTISVVGLVNAEQYSHGITIPWGCVVWMRDLV